MNESGEQYIQRADEKGNSTKHGNQSPDEMPPSKILAETRPPTELPHSTNNPKNTKTHKPNWCETGTFWLEVAGVLGLAFYCWVNWKEWGTFDSERVTMEKESVLDQRAWIGPGKIDRSSSDGTNNCFYILHFKNIGKTPAFKVVAVFNVATDINSIPIFGEETPTNTSAQVLFPETDDQINSPTILPSIIADAMNGKVPSYIYGIIWYDDVFKKHHWTRFRLVDDIRNGITYPALNGNECDTNN